MLGPCFIKLVALVSPALRKSSKRPSSSIMSSDGEILLGVFLKGEQVVLLELLLKGEAISAVVVVIVVHDFAGAAPL